MYLTYQNTMISDLLFLISKIKKSNNNYKNIK